MKGPAGTAPTRWPFGIAVLLPLLLPVTGGLHPTVIHVPASWLLVAAIWSGLFVLTPWFGKLLPQGARPDTGDADFNALTSVLHAYLEQRRARLAQAPYVVASLSFAVTGFSLVCALVTAQAAIAAAAEDPIDWIGPAVATMSALGSWAFLSLAGEVAEATPPDDADGSRSILMTHLERWLRTHPDPRARELQRALREGSWEEGLIATYVDAEARRIWMLRNACPLEPAPASQAGSVPTKRNWRPHLMRGRRRREPDEGGRPLSKSRSKGERRRTPPHD